MSQAESPPILGMTDRPDAPAPMRRLGPRPLALHLALAAKRSNGSSAASPSSGSDLAPGPDPALIRGIAAYRRHPYHRTLADPPVIWAEGSSRLLDYGGTGPLVLVVPSLINRAYVLDLTPEHSMLRHLAASGVHPLLLDWGWPGEVERRFSLTDYVVGRAERALDALPGPSTVLGYCMGGLLSVAIAQRRVSQVRGLLLLATPWDFHAASASAGPSAMAVLAHCAPALAAGTLPVDILQAMFALQDRGAIAEKFREFGAADQNSGHAKLFVALEDWLSDGVPLSAPVAHEVLGGWYGANSPAAGHWRLAGEVVDPAQLRLPVMVALPAQDRIVPPESAAPLAKLITDAAIVRPQAGHVGMVAGSRARDELWEPVLSWLRRV